MPDPVATLDPHGGVDGVAVVTGQLGDSVGTAAVVAEYAVGKVQIVPLVKNPSGSGYTGTAAAVPARDEEPGPGAAGLGGQLFVGDWTTGIIYRITPQRLASGPGALSGGGARSGPSRPAGCAGR